MIRHDYAQRPSLLRRLFPLRAAKALPTGWNARAGAVDPDQFDKLRLARMHTAAALAARGVK